MNNLASIITAARMASRDERQRHNGLIQETRHSFRNRRSGSGRRSQGFWKKQIFLVRRCNTDFYPSLSECSYLQARGLGNYLHFFYSLQYHFLKLGRFKFSINILKNTY